MPPSTNLRDTEIAVGGRLGHMNIDYAAMHAVSSLHRAANATRAHLTNTVLRERDISWTGFVVLWSVWIYDSMPTWQAAESASISKATLTGVVGTLESRGWIERSVGTHDRRLIYLSLTDSGRVLMEEIYPAFNAVETEVVAQLPERKVKDLTKSLRRIVQRLEELEQLSEPTPGSTVPASND